ncbi:MAG: CDP-glycerol glycerophosphotransferase family protein [Leucobacter sp.]
MTSGGFDFGGGNLQKLLAIPKYLLSMLFAVFIPRSRRRWVFGSGIGVGEGALALARELRDQDPDARIVWIVGDAAEAELAEAEGFTPKLRRSRHGFWATLRAGYAVVTHGLGDVNRFGITGATVIHLGHGAPLKLLHLDSPVTTSVRAPGPLRALLERMYRLGARRVAMYVAGSGLAADRLRSAYRVDPGKVRALGDPRDDELATRIADPEGAARSRARLRALLDLPPDGAGEPLILYAPTWRDGEPDPAEPSAAEAAQIRAVMERLGARLLIRSHPLGAGAYDAVLGERVHMLGSDRLRDITSELPAFHAIITDYSSIAVDFALTGAPIVWFAPDLARYTASRGLYEPLEVTAAEKVQRSWPEALARLEDVLAPDAPRHAAAQADTRALARRFHAHPGGKAAARVLAEIRRLSLTDRERVPEGAIFFESFYGRQAACNPLALDREIAARFPAAPRYWSVISERVAVPEGATPVLVGGPDWLAVRRRARLLVVNDWLRYGFRRRRGQTVLQTWHGTMLKHLALGRPGVGLRTRLAIRRESRRWSLLLSQNPHSTEQFRRSYAYRGEILETGYPRDDRLARAVADGERIGIAVDAARRALGVPPGRRVLAYAPTWRDDGRTVDPIDVRVLAAELGEEWTVLARGHSRSGGSYLDPAGRVIDASTHADVNDVLLAADLLVTDYSSVMFDAAVARVPMAFFVPDLASYRDRERGFTFDFEREAPGPLLTTRAEVVEAARTGVPLTPAYEAWCARFTPYDDGRASSRVVDALIARGALG